MLEPDNTDILRFLVESYARLGRFEEELEYLRRLAGLLPDDRSLRRLIPVTLTRLGRDEEALQLLFKLDYELEENDRDRGTVASLIADTALRLGKLDVAERYTEKGEEQRAKNGESFASAKWEDPLRMGHIRLLQGDMKGCLDHYGQFVNIYCGEKGEDIKAALGVLDARWSDVKLLNGKSSDLLLIRDILQAAGEKPKA